MTPDMRKDAWAVLAEVLALSPDVRLGQVLAHLGFLGEAHVGKGLAEIDDDELIAVMYRHRTELLARSQGDPNPSHSGGAAISVSGSSTDAQPAPSTDP